MVEQNIPERKRLPVSVSAAVFITDEQGRLLLLEQAKPGKGNKWGPPAGGMEEVDADPVAIAHREAEEEMGKFIELIDMLGVYTTPRQGSKGIGFVFRARIIGDCPERVIAGEISNSRFFTPTEIRELIVQDMLYKPEYNLPGIEDWLNQVSYPVEVIRPQRRIV